MRTSKVCSGLLVDGPVNRFVPLHAPHARWHDGGTEELGVSGSIADSIVSATGTV
jgi:hypothetical protein